MGNSPRKHIIDTYHAARAMHQRIRAVTAAMPFDVKLKDFPDEPQTSADLRAAVEILRDDITKTDRAMAAWDRSRNGCEVRTIPMIETDIETDERLLRYKVPDPAGRDEETIRGNVAYDRMQIDRSTFYR